MKKWIYALMCFPLLAVGQANEGIKFHQGPSWQKVLAKAKAENKYIFVDCFATWCVPCKQMSEKVFPQKQVGDYLNAKFISVSVQMDTTDKDSKAVKAWYADAQTLAKQNKIKAYPTLLYFSPQGKLVNKAVGAPSAEQFIKLAADAVKYDELARNYAAGKKDVAMLPFLAATAQRVGEEGIAATAGAEYIAHLQTLGPKQMFTKDNIGTLMSLTRNSKAPGFAIVYLNRYQIDQVMGDSIFSHSASEGFIDGIISKEDITPAVTAAGENEPDWDGLQATIAQKYNAVYADRALTNAKIGWYEKRKKWPQYCKNHAHLLRTHGDSITDWLLNNRAWSLFERCSDRESLDTAIGIMESIVWRTPDDLAAIDTYANLLYRAGRTADGLRAEESVVAKVQAEMAKHAAGSPEHQSQKAQLDEFSAALNKMKQGTPTWPQT